ncbi:MAG: redoxin domain-containing protein [Flavobacteriales bacterium]|nr:redoxin domain-containing protein [Flavobacteriales bacterium]
MKWVSGIGLALTIICTLGSCNNQPQKLRGLIIQDRTGRPVPLADIQKFKANIFVFFSPECPLSENYSLTYNTIFEEFQDDLTNFYLVFPGTFYTTLEIDSFCQRFEPAMTVLLDTGYALTHALGATITPEAFVVDGDGITRYSGKIDNWAFSLGKQRRKASEHYLKDAIHALLENKEVVNKKTKAVGCLIE